MIELFIRSYKAIVKRGFISHLTKDWEFILKMDEELNKIADSKTDLEKVREAIDLMTVCANFIQHKGFSIKVLLEDNVIHNETRKD